MTCIICNSTIKCSNIAGFTVCNNCKAAYYVTNNELLAELSKQFQYQKIKNTKETADYIISVMWNFLNNTSKCTKKTRFDIEELCDFNKIQCRFCRFRLLFLKIRRFPKSRNSSSKEVGLKCFLNNHKLLIFDSIENFVKIGNKIEVNENQVKIEPDSPIKSEPKSPELVPKCIEPPEIKSLFKIDDILKFVHTETTMHKHLRSNTDMNMKIYEVSLGQLITNGFEKPAGHQNMVLDDYCSKSALMSTFIENNTYYMKSFLKKLLVDISDAFYDSQYKLKIISEVDVLLNIIYDDFKMLPTFIRLMSSEDESGRLRYDNGTFAVSNSSLFMYGAVNFGVDNASVFYDDCKRIGGRFKSLSFYQLALVTVFAMAELTKELNLSSVSRDVQFLLNIMTVNVKYLISVMQLEEHSAILINLIKDYYQTYFNNFYASYHDLLREKDNK